jgi:carotenoid 1,2-hydratase
VDAVSDCGSYALSVIAFVGSVFSPYYHWAGRRDPDDHVAFNVALYRRGRNAWAMTERGKASLERDDRHLKIGASRMELQPGRLMIHFDEMALPWPGQRLLPRRITGDIEISAESECDAAFALDPEQAHVWSPRLPRARAVVRSQAFPGGGWTGHAYHDVNFGCRPVEQDFIGWDWARGVDRDSGETVILYDAELQDGRRQRLAMRFGDDGVPAMFDMPSAKRLPRGFWGVGGSIACDEKAEPAIVQRLEDSPFYRRSLVGARIVGHPIVMVHETLDCRRLAHPLVRLMLPFRMPRRT